MGNTLTDGHDCANKDVFTKTGGKLDLSYGP